MKYYIEVIIFEISTLTKDDYASEVNVEIANMVIHIHVSIIAVAAALILTGNVITHHMAILDFTLVKHLSVHMQEAPIFKRQMRDGITTMSNSSLEVRSTAVLLVKPDCELGVTDSRRTEVVKVGHFVLVGQEVADSMGGDGCSQTVSCHAESSN